VNGKTNYAGMMEETDHRITSSLAAGCTTGSLCPKCPSVWSRAHSLYLALVFSASSMMKGAGSRHVCQAAYVEGI
jgi:hypothetical protein